MDISPEGLVEPTNSCAENTDMTPSPTKRTPITKRGRPKKNFAKSSKKSKNRRASELIAKYSLEELEYAIQKLKRGCRKEEENCLTPPKALALCLDLDLSERKYNVLRNTINDLHPNCFPSLYTLRMLKQNLVPTINASETSAEVDVETIMCKTVEGILDQCDIPQGLNTLQLIGKWGMDGSSGHSRFKQTFCNVENSDEFMFVIAFVPIK